MNNSRSSPKNVYSINKHVVIIKLLGIRLVKLRFDGPRFLLARVHHYHPIVREKKKSFNSHSGVHHSPTYFLVFFFIFKKMGELLMLRLLI